MEAMSRASVVSRIAHDSCIQAPCLLGRGYWWDELDPDFAYQNESFDLDLGDRIQVGTTAATDTFLRAALAGAVSATAIPMGFHPLSLYRAIQATQDLYGPMAESGDPTLFFKKPPPGVRVQSVPGDWFPRFQPDDGACETLTFDTPFMPVNPALHDAYRQHGRNRTAHARYWRHADGPRPTLMAVHGFTADFYLLNEWFFALPWFYRMGFDVLLYTLPFHGSRQTRFSPFSGYGFFAGGPAGINETVAQAVFDFRIFVDWLQEVRGVEHLGVTGVSLGGFTSAILAAVEPRLAFAVPNVPVISLVDLVMEWQPIGMAVRTGMKALGMTIQEARKLTAVSCPLTYRPLLPSDRLMIVGGVGDRLAPPKQSRLLWDHWGRCRIHWFPGSHILHLDRGGYLRQMAVFFDELGLIAH